MIKDIHNQKTQVLLRDPATKKITPKGGVFDSIKVASKHLSLSYKTLKRHFEKNKIQMYGALKFIKIRVAYNLDIVIWEKYDKFLQVSEEIRDLKFFPRGCLWHKLENFEGSGVSDEFLLFDKPIQLKNELFLDESLNSSKEGQNYILEYVDLKNNNVAEKFKKDTEGKVGVYLIENLVNNFKFIGVVKNAGKDRLNFYRTFRKFVFSNSERYRFLKNDIKSHGIECFKFAILEFTNEQKAVIKKTLYITKLNPEYNKKQLSKTADRDIPNSIERLAFSDPNTKSYNRIGPHLEKMISIIFGTLLGDSYAERREYETLKGTVKGGTRICFQQENSNMEKLMHI